MRDLCFLLLPGLSVYLRPAPRKPANACSPDPTEYAGSKPVEVTRAAVIYLGRGRLGAPFDAGFFRRPVAGAAERDLAAATGFATGFFFATTFASPAIAPSRFLRAR